MGDCYRCSICNPCDKTLEQRRRDKECPLCPQDGDSRLATRNIPYTAQANQRRANTSSKPCSFSTTSNTSPYAASRMGRRISPPGRCRVGEAKEEKGREGGEEWEVPLARGSPHTHSTRLTSCSNRSIPPRDKRTHVMQPRILGAASEERHPVVEGDATPQCRS
jgi:hypothetical protein